MATYNLPCHYDSKQSFYGKAKVIETAGSNIISLKSYETVVAIYNTEKGVVHITNTQSRTIKRHIKEFLLQNGFNVRGTLHLGYYDKDMNELEGWGDKTEQERIDETCDKFEKAYNSLSQERKDMLARSGVMMHSMEDVKGMTSFMNMMSAIDMVMDLCKPNK